MHAELVRLGSALHTNALMKVEEVVALLADLHTSSVRR